MECVVHVRVGCVYVIFLTCVSECVCGAYVCSMCLRALQECEVWYTCALACVVCMCLCLVCVRRGTCGAYMCVKHM